MDEILKMQIEESQESLIEQYELAMSCGKHELLLEAQDQNFYLEIMKELLVTKNEGQRCEKALEKAKVQDTLEDYERVYEEEYAKNNANFKPEKSSEFKAFKKKLEDIKKAYENLKDDDDDETPSTSGNHVESDEFVMQTAISTIDPITKRRMENPVKNRHCGHHYEKSSILEAIKLNKRLKCPVAGCPNKKFVTEKDVKDDEAMKIQIINTQTSDDDDDPLG